MNSGNSSRRRTPRCARLASPGRGPGPPPTIAAVEAEWCGARNGGSAISGRPGGRAARRRSGSASPRAPRRVERRQDAREPPREHRLPVPGGPASRRLCAPAAAISSARRARSCPRTSARSGCAGAGRAPVRRRRVRRRLPLAAQVGDGLGQVAERHGVDAGELGLRRRLGGAEEAREPGPARALRGREHPADRPDAAVEGELAERRVPASAEAGI